MFLLSSLDNQLKRVHVPVPAMLWNTRSLWLTASPHIGLANSTRPLPIASITSDHPKCH